MAGNNSKTKQVIIMREDLNLSNGKMMAQAAHASLSAVLSMSKSADEMNISIDYTEEENEWFKVRFTKIVLGIKSEQELIEIHKMATELGLNVSRLIIDAGFTELDKPTLTCIAIGPNYNEKIDVLTKKLRVFSGTEKEKKNKKKLESLIEKYPELKELI